jgi:hypothetical protein
MNNEEILNDKQILNNKEIKKELFKKMQELFDNLPFTKLKYPILEEKRFHREKTKPLKDIDKIKEELVSKIGFIPIFAGLSVMNNIEELPLNYLNVEKNLLLFYQLLVLNH